jgi:hypothetical protein
MYSFWISGCAFADDRPKAIMAQRKKIGKLEMRFALVASCFLGARPFA